MIISRSQRPWYDVLVRETAWHHPRQVLKPPYPDLGEVLEVRRARLHADTEGRERARLKEVEHGLALAARLDDEARRTLERRR